MNVKTHLQQFRSKFRKNEATETNNSDILHKTKARVSKEESNVLGLSDLPNGNNGTIRIRGIDYGDNMDNITTNETFKLTNNLVQEYINKYK